MKAYIVNDTEFYAAENSAQAGQLHFAITQDEEMEIMLAKLDTPWRTDDSGKPTSTLGAELEKATEPGWMGSTEA